MASGGPDPRPKPDKGRRRAFEHPEEAGKGNKPRQAVEVPGCIYSTKPSSSKASKPWSSFASSLKSPRTHTIHAVPHQVHPQDPKDGATGSGGLEDPRDLGGLTMEGHRELQLRSVDGGTAAWRFLFGAFMVEALQWGWCKPVQTCLSPLQKLTPSYRICPKLWCLPELLLRARAFQRKQRHCYRGNIIHRYCLPWRPDHHANSQAVAAMAQTHDLVWLDTVNPRLVSRKLRQRHWILDRDTRYRI